MNNNVQIIEKKTNYLAIAGFVCSLVTSGLLAFILSFIGLKKAEDCHSGHGLAIAGIIISALKITVYFILALIFTPRYVATPIKNSRCSDAYNCSCAYMSCECTYEDGFGEHDIECSIEKIDKYQIGTTTTTTYTTTTTAKPVYPNFVNGTYSIAEISYWCNNHDVIFLKEEVENDEYEPGEIYGQTPAPGSLITPGDALVIYVAK